MTREDLTKAMRWKIAEYMAEDRLEDINSKLEDVIVKDTLYTRYIKRWLDIIIALIALICTFPINICIGVITFFDVGRPIFFKQERVGKNGKVVLLCQLFQYRVKLVTVRTMPLHKQHHLPVGQVNLPAITETEPAGSRLFCPG